jgi:hypothetical protein
MNELIPVGPVSPLRQRLIDDMTMRRFSRETQRNYIRDVGRFATWLGRSPHTAIAEDLRRFQIEQQEAGVPVPTMNKHLLQPRSSARAALTRLQHHRAAANDQQPPERALTHLRDRTQLPLTASRVLPRCEANPGGKVTPLGKSPRWRRERQARSCRDRTDTWDRHQPARDLVFAGAARNLLVELGNLPVEHGQPSVVWSKASGKAPSRPLAVLHH